MFDVNETLLRYWEKEFPNIAPKKAGRNIRQYTEEDVEAIRLVHNLLKVRGLKISAARELLRKNKEGAQNIAKVMDSLQEIRDELVALRKGLDALV